ncbi:hypothetical protein CY34DRAFT_98484 [Suillus luteus UH-Slu-Lm8-n1]|uniref:Non-specific serine/threonine protein kinase n=1 Tax=Suillus luteus UH-Slu-Lm8-n1 TaxID=930992 RepID=A0A0C9ZXI7_9AGAM|nr:hypothetical protein CY34DRAFT_98484 [Suillus luteus UH-Slu-Lm8-n1]
MVTILTFNILAVVYHTQNFIKDDLVAVKLEPISNHSSSVWHEYNILKRLAGGIGIPCIFWFGRESTYHALVLDLLGLSLHDIFIAHDRRFSLHNISKTQMGYVALQIAIQ